MDPFLTRKNLHSLTHHHITPKYPRANRETEQFIQLLNKTEQIAHMQGKDNSERSSCTRYTNGLQGITPCAPNYTMKIQEVQRVWKKTVFVLDYVPLKKKKYNKWLTAFKSAFYIIKITCVKDGRELSRDRSQLKPTDGMKQWQPSNHHKYWDCRQIVNYQKINRDKGKDRYQHAYWTMFLPEKRQLPYEGSRLYVIVVLSRQLTWRTKELLK